MGGTHGKQKSISIKKELLGDFLMTEMGAQETGGIYKETCFFDKGEVDAWAATRDKKHDFAKTNQC